MHKRIAAMLLLMLMLPLIVACGETTTTPTSGTGTQATAGTTTGTETTTGGDKLRVGLVTDVGRLTDKSFNESSWNGVQMARDQLGAEVKAIETQDPNDYAKNIDTLVNEGYTIIVTVGFALNEATAEAAKRYPNVKFIGVDQFQGETLPNVAGLIFNEDQAGFLAGALAAHMTKNNKIGGILATDTVPPVWKFGEGFRLGALSVKPDVDVSLVFHNDVGIDKTFTDPEWGKLQANSMMDKDIDVIFAAGGNTGNGALLGVAERGDSGVMAIGVDTDQYFTVVEAQPVLLSSALKKLDEGVFTLIKAIDDGSFKGGNFTGNVGLAPFHNFESQVPADVAAELKKLEEDLRTGAVKTNVPASKP